MDIELAPSIAHILTEDIIIDSTSTKYTSALPSVAIVAIADNLSLCHSNLRLTGAIPLRP